MEWFDQAIVINVKKFNENSAIIHLLSQNYGLYKGMVRNLFSKNSIATFQIGNIVDATWKARLPEHLGNFNLELVKQIIGYVIDDKNKLLILQSICTIIDDCLAERQPEHKLFTMLSDFLEILRKKDNCLKDYILFEVNFLSELGFGLDLSECAVSGAIDDLSYVSPKTGRAVTKSVGHQYHDKLLKLPKFLINNQEDLSDEDMVDGLILAGYFLYKHIYQPKNFLMPESRSKILSSQVKIFS
jgi:DNA repair protein RecO (recombination protein O)